MAEMVCNPTPANDALANQLWKVLPIAEPDSDHLLLHVQAVRHVLDLLAGRFGVLNDKGS